MKTLSIITLNIPTMILQASLQHAETLSVLGVQTFYDSHKYSAPAQELETYMEKVYNIDSIKRELNDPSNIYHLIKHEDSFVGFSKMEFDIDHNAIEIDHLSKMDQIYVLESFHGLKLGAKLLMFNIEYSKSHGQRGMWLVVWVGNKTAISFYERFGFQIITQSEFQLTDKHRSPCYIMLLVY